LNWLKPNLGAYKDIDQVMLNQNELVDILRTLKQVVFIKGHLLRMELVILSGLQGLVKAPSVASTIGIRISVSTSTCSAPVIAKSFYLPPALRLNSPS